MWHVLCVVWSMVLYKASWCCWLTRLLIFPITIGRPSIAFKWIMTVYTLPRGTNLQLFITIYWIKQTYTQISINYWIFHIDENSYLILIHYVLTFKDSCNHWTVEWYHSSNIDPLSGHTALTCMDNEEGSHQSIHLRRWFLPWIIDMMHLDCILETFSTFADVWLWQLICFNQLHYKIISTAYLFMIL